MAGQVLGMIESGRQTAPPQFEVVLVTSRVFDFSLEASVRGSESVSTALNFASRDAGADVCQHLTTELVTAASASPNPVPPPVSAAF